MCKWLCLRCRVKRECARMGTLSLRVTRGVWPGEWQAVCERLSLCVCDQVSREEACSLQ